MQASSAAVGWIAFDKNGLVAKVSMETAGDAQPDDTPPSQADRGTKLVNVEHREFFY